MTDRKTITVDADVHAALDELKRVDESWTDLLRRLTGGRDGEHGLNTLTEAHIEDIAATTARRTAEELETRLR